MDPSTSDSDPAPVLPYKTPILSSLYTMGYELRESNRHSTTYLYLDKSSNEPYSCKTITKENISREYDVWREIQVMYRVLGVQNAAKIRETYEDPHHVYIVMELCQGGDLFDRILNMGTSYSEREAAKMMRTIVEFVQACHSLGVMHRDLKPENLLFKSDDEDSELVVADFGLAVFFHEGDRFKDIVGNPYYVAPEVVNKSYGPEADVWSVGVILYILLSGVPPFSAETNEGIFRKILDEPLDFESEQWADVSDEAKDLIGKMMEKDPELRISVNDILCHPWMLDESKVPDKPLDAVVLLRLQQFSAFSRYG